MESSSLFALAFGTVILVLIIAAYALFLVTLQNTLKAIEPENRTMEPGKVWLLFIPFFSFVWSFIVVKAIADSIKLQLEKYGVYSQEKPTYNIGIAMSVVQIFSIVPIVKGFASLATMVCWIAYWIKVNEKKNEIKALSSAFGKTDEASIFNN